MRATASTILHDLRFGFRSLVRRSRYSLLAVSTIAIGMAASVSLYTLVDSVLLKPLPYPASDRLVAIWQTNPEWRRNRVLGADWDHIALSMPQYRDLASLDQVFEQVGAWHEVSGSVRIGTRSEFARITNATVSLGSVLQLQPKLGRYFNVDDITSRGSRVALISNAAWQSWFASDSGVIGQSVLVETGYYTIIGVLPEGIYLDQRRDAASAAAGGPRTSAIWIPAEGDTAAQHDRNRNNYNAVARLRVGVSMEAIQPVIDRTIHPTEHERQQYGTYVSRWQADQTRQARGPLVLLLLGAGLLLLIASVNTAMLTVGEAASRERELASRVAVGATRPQIVRQLLIESAMLATAGLLAGVLLAIWVTQILVRFTPPDIIGNASPRLDAQAFLVASTATILVTLLIGLAPALNITRFSPAHALRQSAGHSGRGRDLLQRGMIGVQLALSVVLLVGATLLFRSLTHLVQVQPGFHIGNLLVVQPEIPFSMWGDTIRVSQLYADWDEGLRSLPGVQTVAAVSQAPFVGGSSATWIRLEGELDDPDRRSHPVQQRVVTPEYFGTLGIPIHAGRTLTRGDRSGAPRVAVVSKSLADRDFPGQSPIGRSIYLNKEWRTIVGISGEVHFRGLDRELEPTVYYPFAQSRTWSLALLIRITSDPVPIIPAIRRVLSTVSPAVAIRSMETMEHAVERSFAPERFRAVLLSLFAVVASLLAAIGMYGVTARAVAQRRREIAIRAALGATTLGTVRPILMSTLWGVVVGSFVGFLIAVPASRFLTPYLFGIGATDPSSYLGILIVLTVISLIGTLAPIVSLQRLDLTDILRSD